MCIILVAEKDATQDREDRYQPVAAEAKARYGALRYLRYMGLTVEQQHQV